MKNLGFRWCMLIGALALTGVALYYFISYVGLAIALSNNGLTLFYKNSMRALWITFGVQSLLLALLYFIVAFRPRAVTREVIVICGLLQLTESVLLFTLAGNALAVGLLGIAAVFVLIGSVLWPKAVEAAPLEDAPPAPAS